MAVETPAHLAILGNGLLALECGLYGRFLGYDVTIIPDGELCSELKGSELKGTDNLEALGIPNAVEATTSLGCQAISAQDANWSRQPLQGSNGDELWTLYAEPLSRTDLLVDSIKCDIQLNSIALVEEEAGPESADDEEEEVEICLTHFTLQLAGPDGTEAIEADVLIDTRQDSRESAINACAELKVDVDDQGIPQPMSTWLAHRAQSPENPNEVESGGALDPERLLTSVDDFYLLGKASFGSHSYLHRDGLCQVRDLFKIIGDREQLDLYRS